jgi:hypothetical protein
MRAQFFGEGCPKSKPSLPEGFPQNATPLTQRGLSEERALGKRASGKGSPLCSVLALTLSCTYRCPLAGAFGKACPFCQGLSELGCPSRSRAFGKRTPFLSGALENAHPFLFRGAFRKSFFAYSAAPPLGMKTDPNQKYRCRHSRWPSNSPLHPPPTPRVSFLATTLGDLEFFQSLPTATREKSASWK